MTQDPRYGEYISGKLTLAGVDLRTPFRLWLDAVYAAWADAPHELLEKLMQQLVIQEAKLDPARARETWGLRPEHQMLNKGMGQSGGYRQPHKIPAAPRGTGR